jgi:hypothetical protein
MKKYKKELGKSAQKEGNEKSPKCDVTIVTCRIERVKLESTPKYVHTVGAESIERARKKWRS